MNGYDKFFHALRVIWLTLATVLLIAWLVLSSGCRGCLGCAPGPRIAANGAGPEDIGPVVAYVLTELQRPMPAGWRIKIVDEYIVMEDGDYVVFADGATNLRTKTVLVYSYQDCLAASSLPHELLHVLGTDHEDKAAYRNMAKIQQRAIRDLCGEEYVIRPPPPIPQAMLDRVRAQYPESGEIKEFKDGE